MESNLKEVAETALADVCEYRNALLLEADELKEESIAQDRSSNEGERQTPSFPYYKMNVRGWCMEWIMKGCFIAGFVKKGPAGAKRRGDGSYGFWGSYMYVEMFSVWQGKEVLEDVVLYRAADALEKRVAMETWGFIHFMVSMCFSVLLLSETCMASIQSIGKINPGFQGSQMTYIDNNGLFLVSNNSHFAFGFTTTTQDVTLFLLVVIHMDSKTTVWTANRGSPIQNSDNFMFDESGNAFLESGASVVWSTNTTGKGVSAMELQDSGNLVLLGNDSRAIWQTFSNPTDTLLSNQDFVEGMKLVSNPSPNNLSYFLEIKSGDMILYAGFQTPQAYWSMGKENRRTINQDGGVVSLASLNANSWRFYDSTKVLLWQFIFSDNSDSNATWVAVLGSDGFITFNNLQNGGTSVASPNKIPDNPCGTPEPCDAYYVCSGNTRCQCPSVLSSASCKTGIVSPCDPSKGSTELVNAGDGLNYFALGFVPPSAKADLNGCKASCVGNCSCLALFFENSSGNCFLFDQIGSLQSPDKGSDFVSYIKISSNGSNSMSPGGSSQKHFPLVLIIAISTEDMHLRPSMTKVVQMLEGTCAVPQPPTSSELESYLKSITEEGTSQTSYCNSNAHLSAVQLSGPR
ncbi:hypothetical protein L1049_012827 [Liquidambar formosana]|uniref:Bulb-type lectin domain-containing protein n=1 Tax=Liquidambar formosana TaxID=63359 RepID=A0AAP0RK55_LIQFO